MQLTFTQSPDAIEPISFTAEGRTPRAALAALERQLHVEFSSNAEPADPLARQDPHYDRNRALACIRRGRTYRRACRTEWKRQANFTMAVELPTSDAAAGRPRTGAGGL